MRPHLIVNMHNLLVTVMNPVRFPIWNHKPSLIHLDLIQFQKQITAPSIYKSKYLEIIYRFNDNEAIYTGGLKLALIVMNIQ